jgi:hypothetical protein
MTSQLGTELRHLADDTDPGRLPTPEALRTGSDRRRRRRRVHTAVGAAIAVTALGGVLITQDPSPRDPQPAEPLPSPTRAPQPEPTEGGAQRHPVETGEHRFSAHAVASLGGRYVVVGDSSDFDEPGPPVYWSDDGVSWQAPGGPPDSVNVTDVIATPDGFLAVGVGRSGTAAWRSPDGNTWVVAPVTASDGGGRHALWGLTETRLGFYAWGFGDRRAQLWRSADGTAWAPVTDGSVFDLPQSESICAVRDAAGGLRATGVEAPRGTRAGHRVVWTSSDGETWVLAEGAGAPEFWCDPPAELGHWEARGDAGVVRIADPYGDGNLIELVPVEE